MKIITNLLNHQGFKKYFANTSWLLFEKVLRIIVGLFVGVWVARYLGPEQFGVFSYAQGFVFLFSAVATLGLDGIIVRELVKSPEKRDLYLGTAFYLKIMGAVLIFPLIFLGIYFTSNDSFTNLIIYIIALSTVFQSFNVIDFYFQSKVLSKYVVYANIISLAISSVIKVILILNNASLIYFAGMIAFDSLVLAMGFIYFYFSNNLSIKNWRFDKNTAKGLLKDSWPLILSGVVVSIYMRIDQVMIKEILGNNAVGQYSVAVTLSEMWYFIPMIISSSLFPAIIEAKKKSEELYYDRLQKLYDLMVWLAIGVALPITFLSDWIVNLLYGSEFNQASSVLTIHIWAGVFVALGVVNSKWLLNENLQVFSVINTTLGAIINIFLNYFLLKQIGIKGAAISTFISYFIAAYFSLILFNKTRISFIKLSKSLFVFRIINVKRNY